jgi:outer membrane protein TolC
VQALPAGNEVIGALRWPTIGSGVPSELLSRRPDIAAAEARLAAASADVQVARAAMLPRLVLGADLGSGSRTFANIFDSPYYTLTAGLTAPIFNNGRLRAQRELASAEQQELLEAYRGSILAGFPMSRKPSTPSVAWSASASGKTRKCSRRASPSTSPSSVTPPVPRPC